MSARECVGSIDLAEIRADIAAARADTATARGDIAQSRAALASIERCVGEIRSGARPSQDRPHTTGHHSASTSLPALLAVAL